MARRLVFLFAVAAAGCGSGTKGFGSEGTGGPATDVNPNKQTDLGNVDQPKTADEVYGHSPNTLYKLDPVTKAVSVVGAFDGCSRVIDIAIDEANNIIGAAEFGLWAIDRATAKCTLIANGTYPNSLSFVPKGTLDPDEEALV